MGDEVGQAAWWAGIFDGLDAVFEFDAFTEINRLILSMVSAQQRAAPPEPCGFESYYPPWEDSMLPACALKLVCWHLISAGAADPCDAACARRVSAADVRRPQAKLSHNSNKVARGRIWQFESYMPSRPVRLHRYEGVAQADKAICRQGGPDNENGID
jgi:hypothetical protein